VTEMCGLRCPIGGWWYGVESTLISLSVSGLDWKDGAEVFSVSVATPMCLSTRRTGQKLHFFTMSYTAALRAPPGQTRRCG